MMIETDRWEAGRWAHLRMIGIVAPTIWTIEMLAMRIMENDWDPEREALAHALWIARKGA